MDAAKLRLLRELLEERCDELAEDFGTGWPSIEFETTPGGRSLVTVPAKPLINKLAPKQPEEHR